MSATPQMKLASIAIQYSQYDYITQEELWNRVSQLIQGNKTRPDTPTDIPSESEWSQSVTHEGREYRIAHKDYIALTGKNLTSEQKCRSDGSYILRDGHPIYHVNSKSSRQPNVFPKADGLKVQGSKVLYTNRGITNTLSLELRVSEGKVSVVCS
jgi:hypothetical protein